MLAEDSEVGHSTKPKHKMKSRHRDGVGFAHTHTSASEQTPAGRGRARPTVNDGHNEKGAHCSLSLIHLASIYRAPAMCSVKPLGKTADPCPAGPKSKYLRSETLGRISG